MLFAPREVHTSEEEAVEYTEVMVDRNWERFSELTKRKEFFHNPEHFRRFMLAAQQLFTAVYGPNLELADYNPENDLFGLEADRQKMEQLLPSKRGLSPKKLLADACIGAFTHDTGNSAVDIDENGQLIFRENYEVTAVDAEPMSKVISTKWLENLGLPPEPIIVVNQMIDNTVFSEFTDYFPKRPLWRAIQMIDQVGQAQYKDRADRKKALAALKMEFQRDGKGEFTVPQLLNFPFARIKMFLGVDIPITDPAFFKDTRVARLLTIWPGLLLDEDNGQLPLADRYIDIDWASTSSLNKDAMTRLLAQQSA